MVQPFFKHLCNDEWPFVKFLLCNENTTLGSANVKPLLHNSILATDLFVTKKMYGQKLALAIH